MTYEVRMPVRVETTPGAAMAQFCVEMNHPWTFVERRKRFVCQGCGVEMVGVLGRA